MCSCPGFWGRYRMLAGLWELVRSGESWRYGFRIRLRKRAAWGRFSLPARARRHASARRALKRRVSFFEWQTESLKRPADAGRRDRNAVSVLKELLVLFESEVGVCPKLGRQSVFQNHAFSGRRTRARSWRNLPSFSAPLEPAFDGGHRDAKDPRNIPSWHPAI